jgi:hypothetical protein
MTRGVSAETWSRFLLEAGFFLPDMLVFPAMLERRGRNARISGDQPMRVLAVIALAMLLAGREGDRIKQSKGDDGMAWSYNVDATTIGRLKA